jgi:hypothetical protein
VKGIGTKHEKDRHTVAGFEGEGGQVQETKRAARSE